MEVLNISPDGTQVSSDFGYLMSSTFNSTVYAFFVKFKRKIQKKNTKEAT